MNDYCVMLSLVITGSILSHPGVQYFASLSCPVLFVHLGQLFLSYLNLLWDTVGHHS
jgi:hypothetical protein